MKREENRNTWKPTIEIEKKQNRAEIEVEEKKKKQENRTHVNRRNIYSICSM